MISVGRKRIAHIDGNKKMAIFRDRLSGFREALTKNNRILEEELICFTEDLSSAGGSVVTQQLLDLPVPPDGIFCSNDTTAISAIPTIKKAGLRVPEDIAMVGFSDTPTSLIIDPPLTTIDDHAFEMGQAAAGMVIRQIEENQQNSSSETIVIQNDFIIRNSTLR